ncbi:MAG: VOC family protein, partial [Phycisphaerae bacterium]
LLGFRPEPHRGPNGRFCEQVVTAPHGEAFGLVLVQGPGNDIAGPLEQISFEAATVGDAAELYRKARAAGAQAIQPRLCNGSWRTFIFDPDGHKLEITVKETGLAHDSVG